MCIKTNIDIRHDLLQEAMELSGLRAKGAVVEEALRRLIQVATSRAPGSFRGAPIMKHPGFVVEIS